MNKEKLILPISIIIGVIILGGFYYVGQVYRCDTIKEELESVDKELEKWTGATIHFESATPEQKIFGLKEDLAKEFEEIKEDKITYISKHEALEDFKDRHKDNPVLMEALDETDGRFSSSLKVKTKSSDTYKEINDFITKNYSEVVSYIDFY